MVSLHKYTKWMPFVDVQELNLQTITYLLLGIPTEMDTQCRVNRGAGGARAPGPPKVGAHSRTETLIPTAAGALHRGYMEIPRPSFYVAGM